MAIVSNRKFEVRPMGDDTIDDCRFLWGQPPEGWCWCVAWEVPTWDGWTERTAEENRRLREKLWQRGEFFGYIFYKEKQPIGWCRVGPTSVWPKLTKSRGLERSEETYAFTCFGIQPEYRRRGFLGAFLELVIKDLSKRGVRQIVAVPKNISGKVPDGQLWNGVRSVYERLGFSVIRETDQFTEMRKNLSKFC